MRERELGRERESLKFNVPLTARGHFRDREREGEREREREHDKRVKRVNEKEKEEEGENWMSASLMLACPSSGTRPSSEQGVCLVTSYQPSVCCESVPGTSPLSINTVSLPAPP